MKKLLLLSIFAFFALVNANVFGQNTGDQPSIGSLHSYWVNGTSASAQTSGVGNNYTWWISKTAATLLSPLTAGTEFTVTAGAYNTSTLNQHSIGLKWNPVAVGTTFYLVVKELGVDGCSNIKAYPIQPKNDFKLLYTVLDGLNVEGDNLSRCAPEVTLSAVGTTIAYDYGSDNFIFKLKATGLYTDWSFDQVFANVLGTATPVTQYKVGAAGAWTPISSNIVVPANALGQEEVFIRVAVDNGTISGGGEEGKTGQSMKLTLSNVKDAGGNAVVEIKNLAGTAVTEQTQTVKARPNTSGISFN
jgi:hypothetical protein